MQEGCLPISSTYVCQFQQCVQSKSTCASSYCPNIHPVSCLEYCFK
uniref:Uncharacterized protein n=1 Tax=Arundo donax TaxID=35708 RepID=A0A0A9H3N8_ARUDO